MIMTKGRIDREGRIVFNDASLSIWEEGSGCEFEKGFKRDVFKRIVQKLNRLGWKCVVPEEMIKQYSLRFAQDHRYCVKGDLKADLRLCGRHIELKMFQNVNAPDRPDHEGRYQYDKEKHMPYLLLLEMERTRRKVRDYLCNVISGYVFKTDRHDGRANKRGPGHLTAIEWVDGCYKTSWHFKGDTSEYEISDCNRKSADGLLLNHKQRVWFADHKGRICTGVAYYNINNVWWVVTGKYDCRNLASFELFTSPPEDIRRKRNEKLRTERLKGLLEKASSRMDFERAIVLRDLLTPEELAV